MPRRQQQGKHHGIGGCQNTPCPLFQKVMALFDSQMLNRKRV
jgi:hypothetical protein